MADDLGKRELAKAERRSRIVKAARDLIRETGDTDLSMRMLAQRAEVSLSTPYNLFGSKRAVVLAVLEDERDLVQRFRRLETSNSIEKMFSAHELAFSYYTNDPDFYRTLWRALLSTTSEDDMGLATPKRLAQTRAIWRQLVQDIADDGYLGSIISVDLLLQAMSHVTGGALLSWAMGSQSTAHLTPSVGLGYALCLSGGATDAGRGLLANYVETYQQALGDFTPSELLRSSETF